MDERMCDDEIRDMLNWLSRGMNADGIFAEAAVSAGLVLSEEDYEFLRECRISEW